MQFITLSQRKTDQFSEAEFTPHLEAEAERARTLYADGFIRQIWHRGDVLGACLLIEAESEATARLTLATLPLVAAGMLEIVAVVPLKPYRGFGPTNAAR
jgi:muconolactone delta-isomerase